MPIRVLLFAVLFALLATQTPACTIPAEVQTLRGAVLAGVNAERARVGIAALGSAPALDMAAQNHACDIARQQRLSHGSGLFSSLRGRLRRAGYAFFMANENLAAGQTSPEQVMRSWMGSPGHRSNILAAPARELGVGVAVGADGQLYWVTIGAAPR